MTEVHAKIAWMFSTFCVRAPSLSGRQMRFPQRMVMCAWTLIFLRRTVADNAFWPWNCPWARKFSLFISWMRFRFRIREQRRSLILTTIWHVLRTDVDTNFPDHAKRDGNGKIQETRAIRNMKLLLIIMANHLMWCFCHSWGRNQQFNLMSKDASADMTNLIRKTTTSGLVSRCSALSCNELASFWQILQCRNARSPDSWESRMK
jgi:hypothetical protein